MRASRLRLGPARWYLRQNRTVSLPTKKIVKIDLKDVRKQLAAQGFAVASGTLEDVERASRFENFFTAAPTSSPRENLRLVPYTEEEAPPRSLSAVYGLSAQPLHTDGAHLLDPPAVIVLHSAHPTPTGTALRKPGSKGPHVQSLPESVREGIFTVRGNGIAFLAGASEGYSRIRFDPVVMSPADAMARAAVEWFAEERAHALIHMWDKDDQLLFIDNHRMLHAREAVEHDVDTRELSRLALNYSEKP